MKLLDQPRSSSVYVFNKLTIHPIVFFKPRGGIRNSLLRAVKLSRRVMITRNYGCPEDHRKLILPVAHWLGVTLRDLFSEERCSSVCSDWDMRSCTCNRCTRWILCTTIAGCFNTWAPLGQPRRQVFLRCHHHCL